LDITWYGHNCFRITERGRITIVTDPFHDGVTGLPPLKLKGDVVTISEESPFSTNVNAVKGQSYVLAGAGEYEIDGVFFYGLPLHNLQTLRQNVAYAIQYDSNLTLVHLGNLSHVPDQSTIEALGEVNIALVPVGNGQNLTAAQAAEVIALIEPNYIIPMQYAIPGTIVDLDPVEKFLKEMGVSKIQEEETLRITRGALPEQPQVVLLKPQES